MVQLEGELGALAAGEPSGVEPLTAELEALPLVIGADRVMVLFRPHPPHGEGENPVTGDQGGDSGPPGRAADPPRNACEPPLPAPISGGGGREPRPGPPGVAGRRRAHGGDRPAVGRVYRPWPRGGVRGSTRHP